MGARDLIIYLVVFAALPIILWRPWVGVIYWVWLSVMNPHRLAFGAAYTFPFAQVVAVTTLIGMVFSRQPLKLKGGAAAWVLLAFVLWTCLTTAFALEPERAAQMLERVLKIQFFTFIALLVFARRDQLTWLLWTIVVSIGFYSIKGGLFTIYTLGSYRVWGPPESFIADNNALALAGTMTIPLWTYLMIVYRQRWVRWACMAAILLTAAAVLGSYSRGAFVAIGAMSFWLWLHSRKKVLFAFMGLIVAGSMVAFMPSKWEDRMESITAYEEDASAQGRINAWRMLTNLAIDRPILGGGFEPYSQAVYKLYLPESRTVLSAHSIYFQVLGEHGFIGFFLFALFWFLTWRMGSALERRTRDVPGQEWASWLARMIQVSLVGYFVGGLFLNLAYWDVPYYLMVLLAVATEVVKAPGGVAAGQNSRALETPAETASLVGRSTRTRTTRVA